MLNFHSKKVMCIQQEIYAHLIMYNFAEMITSHVVIEKKQTQQNYFKKVGEIVSSAFFTHHR